MPTAEQVVVEILARTGGFDSKIRQSASAFGDGMNRIGQSADKAERAVEKSTRNQRREIRALEAEMRGSASKISGSMGALAASVATFFSGRELIGLVDDFTRFQNQLKVAGLEGEDLKRVQDALFVSAQKYGVSLNALGELYSKTSQSSKELGATQTQLLTLTNATSQALLITGTSSVQASGAILGLTQALSGAKVQAEEFNQINEGGLRPLLQAAAASERWGGSVAKLRKDVVDGKVTAQEFYKAILDNSKKLETQASKATLTLAAGFTALKNALTVYFGEADKANGVSAALGQALGALARNLDVLIPALAAVIVLIGVRYIAAAAAATVSTIALGAAAAGTAAQMGAMGAAAFALQARLAGAATTAEAMSFALVGMKGALATAAVVAMGAAIYYVATEMTGAKDATGAYAVAQREAEAITKKAADAADKLATAHGKARVEALALARAEAENIKQKLASARASITLAKAELARANVRLNDRIDAAQQTSLLTGQPGAFGAGLIEPGAKANQAQANLAASQKTVKDLTAALGRVEKAIAAGPPTITAPSVDGKKKDKKGRDGPTGPTAAEIEERFNAELASLAQQTLSAQSSQARSAEEKAEIELRSVELARIRTEAGIKADKDYSTAQKSRLLAQLESLAFEERARIDLEKRRQQEEEARSLAEERYNGERDQLDIAYDLATTATERKDLALKILELEERHAKAILEGIIASEAATEAEKERARILLANLKATSGGKREQAEKQNQSPLKKFLDEIPDDINEINEALENVAVNGLDTFADSMTDALMGFKSLKQVGLDVLRSLTADLVKLALKMLLLKAIKGIFGGFSGGGLVSGKAKGGLIGYARGGQVGFPGGGLIVGPGTETSDSIPAMTTSGRPLLVSDGEYVMRGAVVRKLGVRTMDQINATGELPRAYAAGGSLRAVQPTNAPAATRGGDGMSSLSPEAVRELGGIVRDAVHAMPPVNLYPTLRPEDAFLAGLNSPGGQRAFFNFVDQNSAKFNSQLGRR